MNTALRMGKKAFSATVVAATIAWSIGLAGLVAPLTVSAATASGDLVRSASLPAVYYVGADGKRYVFPNQKTYSTWYANFSAVRTISDTELASLGIGGNVTYKPGVRMVKIQSDPKTYAVDAGGTLRWVTSEAVATALYGATWNTMVDDVSDAFFTNYRIGADLTSAASFSAASVTAAAASINADKALSTAQNVGSTGSVMASAMTAASANIISDGGNNVAGSQAAIPMFKFDVSSTGGTLTTLKLKRLGISSDSDVNNAYLWDGATLVSEMSSLSGGVMSFSGLSLAVSGTKTLGITMDLNRTSTAGKTIGFGFQSASDVVFAAGNATGTFPINGNLMTVAVVNDLGRVTLTAGVNSATVDPGTTNFEAQRFTLQASNQNMTVSSLRMKMLGSINTTDLANMALFDGATQLGTTQQTLDANKYVVFDLSATPLSLTNGATKTLSFRLDVKGGSTRTIQFSFQKSYDIQSMDSQYGVAVKTDTALGIFGVVSSVATTVNPGSLTVNLSTDSPTGNVTKNATNIKLAKYDLKAIGEGIKVSTVSFYLTSDNFADGDGGPAGGADLIVGNDDDDATTNWTNMRNVRLVYNGTQVGSTQTTVAEETTTAVTTNFTVAAGTTGILEIYGDIAAVSGNTIDNGEAIKARLSTGASNGQRSDSLGTINVPAANTNGNNLVVSSSANAVAASKNSSFGAPTVVKSTNAAKLASVLLTSTAGEAVDMSTLIFKDQNPGSGALAAGTNSLGAAFANLKLMVGATQVAPIVNTNAADAAATTYTFNLSPAVTINPNQSVQFDLYGDVLSNATWTNTDGVQISSITGSGKVTATNVTLAAAVRLQAITVSAAGTLSLSNDSSTPIATQLVMGATAQPLGVWKFSSSNVENITLTRVDVTNSLGAGSSGNVRNLSLWVNGVQVGSTIPALDGANKARFDNLTVIVPKASQVLVSMKGDVSAFADGAVSNTPVAMQVVLPGAALPAAAAATITGITGDSVVALGASGQYPLSNATTITANSQFPVRTTLTATMACSGSCSSRTRSASDIVGKMTLTGTASQDAQLNSALQGNDEDATNGVAAGNWTFLGVNIVPVASAAQSIDGTKSILYSAVDPGAGAEWSTASALVHNLGTDPSVYSRLSFWARSNVAHPAADFKVRFNSVATLAGGDYTNPAAGSGADFPALVADTWTFVTISLNSASLSSTKTFLEFVNFADAGDGDATSDDLYIDNIRLYNDSISLDVSGDLFATPPIGTKMSMRDSGGTVRAVGYYTGTSAAGTVTLIMGDDIGGATPTAPTAGQVSVGATSQVYDLVTSTVALTKADTPSTEVLSVSATLGTSSSAGAFRWYDQAVTITSPIIWLNPAPGTSSPISVSMGY